ncbi:hypothetical protein ACS0TY_014310 [Phlomoides rotata]
MQFGASTWKFRILYFAAPFNPKITWRKEKLLCHSSSTSAERNLRQMKMRVHLILMNM